MLSEDEIKIIEHSQPTINIGMLGHVANGKSTITKAITGVATQKHSEEKEKNLTIKLGYANAKIFRCQKCPRPECFQARSSDTKETICSKCNEIMLLEKHVSFTDCPGHNQLMATMLNGTCIMDGCILVESVENKVIPAPQTAEHLIASEILGVTPQIITMNKIDLVIQSVAKEKIDALKRFVKNTLAENSPIVPVCANLGYNIDVICEYICLKFARPKREFDKSPKFIATRSFNINKNRVEIDKLVGGVLGGSVLEGVFRLDDKIEVKPGVVYKNGTKWACKPVVGRICSLYSEKNSLKLAIPGGLIAIGTTIDPMLTVDDRMVGHTVGLLGKLPPVYGVITVSYNLLTKIIGSTDKDACKLETNETVIINHNASNIQCKVLKKYKNKTRFAELECLTRPICASITEKISLSKKVDNGWRLIGMGVITEGIEC